jgi:hypothetical protein
MFETVSTDLLAVKRRFQSQLGKCLVSESVVGNGAGVGAGSSRITNIGRIEDGVSGWAMMIEQGTDDDQTGGEVGSCVVCEREIQLHRVAEWCAIFDNPALVLAWLASEYVMARFRGTGSGSGGDNGELGVGGGLPPVMRASSCWPVFVQAGMVVVEKGMASGAASGHLL